jgi:hypothetical protein
VPADDPVPDVLDRCDADTITPGCPVDCLMSVVSASAFNLLARAYFAPFDPPRTVADVVGLYRRGRLREIWGLGPRRIGEIEVGLVFAGLVAAHRRFPASRPAS